MMVTKTLKLAGLKQSSKDSGVSIFPLDFHLDLCSHGTERSRNDYFLSKGYFGSFINITSFLLT